MILCVNTPCDETTHHSHVIHTHYNNVRYIEWITRVNGARCLTARQLSDNIRSCAFITRINAYTVRRAYRVRMPLLEVCLYGESTYRVNTPERWSVLIYSELLLTLVNAYNVEVLVWRGCLFGEVARVWIFPTIFQSRNARSYLSKCSK